MRFSLHFFILMPTIFLMNMSYSQETISATKLEQSSDKNIGIDMNKCTRLPYPRSALREELEGDTILLLSIAESGKIENVKIEKSSGWRILDDASTQSMIGCQVTSSPIKSKISKKYTFRWSLGNDKKDPAVHILIEKCRAPSKVRFAEPDESGLGIVVGKKSFDVAIEWGSGQSELDRESIDIVKSCKLLPPFSIRFFPKN